MGAEFTPIFLFILIGLSVAIGMLSASAILGPKKKTSVKQMPYESGMDPIGDVHRRFDVRYHLIAIAFLLFDVELLFLYPWCVAQWSSTPVVAAAPIETVEVVEKGAVVEVAEVVEILQAATVGIPPELRGLVFCEILVFIAVLAAAFAYAWKKGVFEWR
jgi:NADH-quinone oxidoreductase subunit A